MSVYEKLNRARLHLQNSNLTKTGENKFAGYKYFELSDIMPPINQIFSEVGLCGIVTFTSEVALLTIYDTTSQLSVCITSPMAEASLKGAHAIQNLGAVQTYMRRYLWMTALEISEVDTLDKTPAAVPVKPKLTNARFAKALESVNEGKYTIQKLLEDFDLTEEQQTVIQEKQ